MSCPVLTCPVLPFLVLSCLVQATPTLWSTVSIGRSWSRAPGTILSGALCLSLVLSCLILCLVLSRRVASRRVVSRRRLVSSRAVSCRATVPCGGMSCHRAVSFLLLQLLRATNWRLIYSLDIAWPACCINRCEKRHLFLSSYVVPSLSWQNDRFNI